MRSQRKSPLGDTTFLRKGVSHIQRQFRSDDTSLWIPGFGNGSDGNYSSAGNATDAPIDSSCAGTAGATSLSATNASFATNKPILIHQTRGTGAGKWELNVIGAYVAGTITTKYPLCNTYTDSGSSQAQVIQLKQYNNFTQNSGHSLTAKAWDGNVGGIIAFLARGTVTITGAITATGKGFDGGTGRTYNSGDFRAQCGENYSADSTYTDKVANGGGGGGTLGAAVDDYGAGGGGGNGTAGSAGNEQGYGYAGGGGSTSGNAGMTLASFGGGGGGGGADESGSVGAGGDGGGIILIIGETVSISGVITSTGNNGQGAAASAGAGAGGSILIKI